MLALLIFILKGDPGWFHRLKTCFKVFAESDDDSKVPVLNVQLFQLFEIRL